jgi:hypothetical protein
MILRGARRAKLSFGLPKERQRIFFSEEKKQKTFMFGVL